MPTIIFPGHIDCHELAKLANERFGLDLVPVGSMQYVAVDPNAPSNVESITNAARKKAIGQGFKNCPPKLIPPKSEA